MKSLSRSLATWRSKMRTMEQLHRLSDRELEDIGFARGDIEGAARLAAAQRN